MEAAMLDHITETDQMMSVVEMINYWIKNTHKKAGAWFTKANILISHFGEMLRPYSAVVYSAVAGKYIFFLQKTVDLWG